jgi:hypothetical protein
VAKLASSAVVLTAFNIDVNNAISTGTGPGGVFYFDGNSATIMDSHFETCSSLGNGGSFYINTQGEAVVFQSCNFTNCTANSGDGGSIYCNSSLTLTSCFIVDGKCTKSGGGIYSISSTSQSTFTFCDFSNVSSTDEGGSIYIANSLTMNSCNFDKCKGGKGFVID